MTPEQFLDHHDHASYWPVAASASQGFDLAQAYQSALQVRQLRIARGEVPRGYKIGFSNRQIWSRYAVHAPIWGTVWDTGLSFASDNQGAPSTGQTSLSGCCQPRIEPELVFGMRERPAPGASLEDLFEAIEWMAPGFEIVQSHLPNWKFQAADTVADGGLHARLVVGTQRPLREVAGSAAQLHELLARTQLSLLKNGALIEQGCGANVLDSPLMALQHFLNELRQCPGAPDLQAGDVITTGTWTDAWPAHPNEQWAAQFNDPTPALSGTASSPLPRLTLDLV